MKLSLKSLIDPEKAALAKARLHAWWEGEEFDAKAFAARTAQEAASGAPAAFEEPAMEPPPAEPRLQALQILWGDGRLMPGEATEDRLQPARLGLPATGVMAVFGPGLGAPVLAAAEAHPGAFTIYEWRDEADPHLRFALSQALHNRATVEALDLDLFSAPGEAWDGAWSLDDFTYAPNPSRLAVQLAKGLKAGASAVIECYVSEGRLAAASAFAAAFAEPHLPEAGGMEAVLTAAGLMLEDLEDLTPAHLAAAKEGFRRLEQALSAAANAGLGPGAAREIAWEAESWAHRMAALHAGKLSRRRFIARKPD